MCAYHHLCAYGHGRAFGLFESGQKGTALVQRHRSIKTSHIAIKRTAKCGNAMRQYVDGHGRNITPQRDQYIYPSGESEQTFHSE